MRSLEMGWEPGSRLTQDSLCPCLLPGCLGHAVPTYQGKEPAGVLSVGTPSHSGSAPAGTQHITSSPLLGWAEKGFLAPQPSLCARLWQWEACASAQSQHQVREMARSDLQTPHRVPPAQPRGQVSVGNAGISEVKAQDSHSEGQGGTRGRAQGQVHPAACPLFPSQPVPLDISAGGWTQFPLSTSIHRQQVWALAGLSAAKRRWEEQPPCAISAAIPLEDSDEVTLQQHHPAQDSHLAGIQQHHSAHQLPPQEPPQPS